MGATLLPEGGAVFRTWAPAARDVYVVTDAHATGHWTAWTPDPARRLLPLGDGTWASFVPGLADGDPYLFWIRGPESGTEGFKRDPYARELCCPQPPFPNCPCLLREAQAYPWHDAGWHPPPFHELIIYQLHVGVFWGADLQAPHYGKFLDVIARIPYLRELGVNAIQLLPIQEYDGEFGLGYAGLDYFSPEMTYQVEDQAELAVHLGFVNALLAEGGHAPLDAQDLMSGPNQLKCLIDLSHLNGLAVIFDLVFNHAGGGFDDRSLWFFDRQPFGDDNRSLYFTSAGWAGGKVFAYWQDPVRQYLIDNALFWLDEYRVDGIPLRRGYRDAPSRRRPFLPRSHEHASLCKARGDSDCRVLGLGQGVPGHARACGSRLRCGSRRPAARRIARRAGRCLARGARLGPPRSGARCDLSAAWLSSRLDGRSVPGKP
jgi:1,4-alpha-glucan branching enzyme